MTERPPPPPPLNLPKPPRRRRIVLMAFLTVLIPVVSGAIISGIVLQMRGWKAFLQPSGSMLPSLLVGDYLFVDQQAYADGHRPEYGDVIVFLVSSKQTGFPVSADGRSAPYIKRVVGLPGDRLALVNGVLTINGTPVPRRLAGEFAQPTSLRRQQAMRLSEQLPNGATYEVLQHKKAGPLGTWGPYVVPDGAYLVLGDNRDDSLDSRSWNNGAGGAVPLADIIGRANYVYWSGFERFGRIGVALK